MPVRDKRFLKNQRRRLADDVRRADRRIAQLNADEHSLVDTDRDVSIDELGGDGDTINYELSATRTLRVEAEESKREALDAVRRIDAGTYGDCESCATQIPRPRLEFIPATRLCVTCKAAS